VLRKDGAEAPLFLVHDVFGELFYAWRLVRNLSDGFPVYGLPAPSAPEKQLRTIQGMAARLTRMIRAIQPQGPYRLAGWSFGATVAYEIATQLIGEDATVEFLGSIDGYYLGPGSTAAEQLSLDEERLLSEIRLVIEERSQVRPDEGRQYLDRYHSNLVAAKGYVAHSIPIPFHLLAADTQDEVDGLLCWDAILPREQVRRIGVSGTHHSMFEPPHLASLADAISKAIRDTKDREVNLPETDYAPIVSIRDGSSGVAPVVCMPGAGGSAITFLDLAGSLETRGPIEAMQPRGIDGVLVPHSTVPAAARAYVQSIRQKYPNGPVHLMGHSFGGWIALEMARQMRDEGRAVASVTIIDTNPPDNDPETPREFSRTEAIMELVGLCEQSAQRSLEIDAQEIDRRDPGEQLELLSQRLSKVGLMPPRSRSTDLLGMVRTFERGLRTSYHPTGSYPDPVVLVMAEDAKYDEAAFEEAMSRWARWAPKLTVWRSPGNHMTMLRKPNVIALAERLSSRLWRQKDR
jgi:arthrofactin-type cyclic lipopeptide synthetase C